MSAEDAALYQRAPGRMRTYAAEDRARLACPLPQLDGTQEAAQAYVDRITRSAWWRKHCPPSWMGDEQHGGRHGWLDESKPPRRIIVKVMPRGTRGLAHTNTVYRHRGRWFPRIKLGAASTEHAVQGWTKAATDPWVVLHEVAHIMVACRDDDERGHGRAFRIAHLDLVRRWAGPEAAAALRAGYEAEGLSWRKPPGTRVR